MFKDHFFHGNRRECQTQPQIIVYFGAFRIVSTRLNGANGFWFRSALNTRNFVRNNSAGTASPRAYAGAPLPPLEIEGPSCSFVESRRIYIVLQSHTRSRPDNVQLACGQIPLSIGKTGHRHLHEDRCVCAVSFSSMGEETRE